MTQIILSRVAPGGAVTALAFLAVARLRSSHVRSGMAGTVLAMEKPVQWMTLQELRDELERTCPTCRRPWIWMTFLLMASYVV